MSHPSENKNNQNPSTRHIDLNKIYPTPKSFDELAHEREELDKLHTKQAPQHVKLLIGIKMYSILVGFALGLSASLAIIPTNIISGVFFSFLIGLVWLAYTVWTIQSASDSLQRLGYSIASFFQLYILCYSILFCVSYFFTAHISFGAFLALASCLHFIVIYCLLAIRVKSS